MRGNQTPSDAIGRHRMHSNARECNPLGAIRRNQTQSDAIRCNQMQSDAISWVKAISSNAIS